MSGPVSHPVWCSLPRCTVAVDPTLGAHRSRPSRGLDVQPMAFTAGLFRAAGALDDRAISTLVELHLGRLDDLSEATGTAVGLLTVTSAAAVSRILSTLAREALR